MAKDKKGSKAVAAAPKPAASKPLESVKAGRVTKPVESAKSAAKDVAKKAKKTSKKAKKEPTPEPSSESEAETSESSASSDSESEAETKPQPKTNGAAKAPAAKDDSDSDDSSSASDSDDEAPPKKASAAKVNGAATATAVKDDSSASDSDDSSDASDMEVDKAADAKAGADKPSTDTLVGDNSSSSESSDDEEADAAPKVGVNGGAKADADDTSDASSSDEESEEEEKPKVEEKTNKKRKAEEAIEQTPKKTKVTVNGEQKDATANLFVGQLSWSVDEEWLTREFEEFGELKGVRVITDRDSGRSKGFGYVEFNEVSDAVTALEAKQGAILDGRGLRIDFSQGRQQRADGQTPQQRSADRSSKYGDTPSEPSTTLFVGNVSFDADESMLSDVFQEYGTIMSVRLPTDAESGSLKGFGYVEMSSLDEAKAAHSACNGTDIAGRSIRLDFAQPRSNSGGSPRGGFGGRGGGRGRGGDRGGRGGRGGFNDRGRGGRGGRGDSRGGFTKNRGGFGDFSGSKKTF